jgi:hypothetical protein
VGFCPVFKWLCGMSVSHEGSFEFEVVSDLAGCLFLLLDVDCYVWMGV